MNKKRLNRINKISMWLENARDINQIKIFKSSLEDLYDEEQDAFDCMPENLQYSMNGERSQEAIDNLETAVDSLDQFVDTYESATTETEREDAFDMIDDVIDALDCIY